MLVVAAGEVATAARALAAGDGLVRFGPAAGLLDPDAPGFRPAFTTEEATARPTRC